MGCSERSVLPFLHIEWSKYHIMLSSKKYIMTKNGLVMVNVLYKTSSHIRLIRFRERRAGKR